jgi:hypothetical protein
MGTSSPLEPNMHDTEIALPAPAVWPCAVAPDTLRHQARVSRRESCATAAFVALRNEFVAALAKSPATVIRTPGFGLPTMSVSDVIVDRFSGSQGEASLHELLHILALCASGKADVELHLRASAWIAEQAKRHAEYHADDLAAELLEVGQ